MWNKKHDKFAYNQGLMPSSAFLLRWILRKAKLNEICELEIDLKKFNTWVGKERGKPYHRRTLDLAIAQLNDQTEGMIVVLKRYTPWIFKILIRPLDFVLQNKHAKREKIDNRNDLNPMYSEDHKKRLEQQQHQNISKIDSLFQKVNLNFTTDALGRIWRMAGKKIENVIKTIELLVYQNSTPSNKPIERPHGFVIDCLKYRWYDNFDLYYQPEIPKFGNRGSIIEFSESLRLET